MCGNMVDIQSATTEDRRGKRKKERKKERKKKNKKKKKLHNGLPYSAAIECGWASSSTSRSQWSDLFTRRCRYGRNG